MQEKITSKPQFHIIEKNKNTTNEDIQKALVKLINTLMIKEYLSINTTLNIPDF